MKNITIILILITLTGCNNFVYNNIADTTYSILYNQDVYYTTTYSALPNIRAVKLYIINNIDYKTHTFIKYRTVKSILTSGEGDCDEYALAFLNVAYVALNIKCNLVLVDHDEKRSVVHGGKIDHAIVELPNGTLIEPQTGCTVEYAHIRYRYTFDSIFN